TLSAVFRGGSIQNCLISSSGLFLVSGTKNQVKNACVNDIAARNPKVAIFSTRLNANGKKNNTTAFSTHFVSTGTVIAVPRMRLGKISGMSVQNTGPTHEQKNARYNRISTSTIVP